MATNRRAMEPVDTERQDFSFLTHQIKYSNDRVTNLHHIFRHLSLKDAQDEALSLGFSKEKNVSIHEEWLISEL